MTASGKFLTLAAILYVLGWCAIASGDSGVATAAFIAAVVGAVLSFAARRDQS